MLFIALTCAAAFHELHAERASASSFLVGNWNKYSENYHPSYVLDGDKKTAWVEGKDGDGEGEFISVELSPLRSARTLRLAVDNGYQKSKDLLSANGAPKKVTIVVLGPNGEESGRTTALLARKMGTQNIELPLSHGLRTVTVTIDEVTPGRVYKDTCITNLRFFVDSDVKWNDAAEKAKHALLLQWAKERKADAAFFAARPPTWPFAASSFDASAPTIRSTMQGLLARPDDPEFRTCIEGTRTVKEQVSTPLFAAVSADDLALIARVVALDAATAELGKGLAAAAIDADARGDEARQKVLDAHPADPWAWQAQAEEASYTAFKAAMKSAATSAPATPVAGGVWRSSPTTKRLPQPDGLVPQLPVKWLRFGDITFFEAQSTLAVTQENVSTSEESDGEKYTLVLGHADESNFLVINDAGGGHAVYSKTRVTSEIRGVSVQTIRTLRVYDAGGHLVAQVAVNLDDQVMVYWQAHELLAIDHLVWDGDKVKAVHRVSTRRDEETLVLEEQTWSARPGT